MNDIEVKGYNGNTNIKRKGMSIEFKNNQYKNKRLKNDNTKNINN